MLVLNMSYYLHFYLQLFDQIRNTTPEVLEKLVAVEGDIMEPGLGISEEDTELLATCVSVVFHAAATVKFDEAIKLSLQMNVLGTKRIVELCHKMPKLVVSALADIRDMQIVTVDA